MAPFSPSVISLVTCALPGPDGAPVDAFAQSVGMPAVPAETLAFTRLKFAVTAAEKLLPKRRSAAGEKYDALNGASLKLLPPRMTLLTRSFARMAAAMESAAVL